MKCRHGYQGPDASKGWTVGGANERAIEQHEKRCKRSTPFWHPGILGRVICCAGCGNRIN